jgi:uncharacterized protein
MTRNVPMTSLPPRRRGLLLSALAAGVGTLGLLSACASPDPVLYTLAPVPGATVTGGPRGVVLREIGLARYLDRPQIVRSTEDFQLSVSEDNWWGEPLGRMIGRVMVANLSSRLPGSSVVAETGAIGGKAADATVEVNILGFAADRARNVRLSAQVAVTRGTRPAGRAVRTLEITATMPTPDIKGQVAAMSAALGELADTTAGMLRP